MKKLRVREFGGTSKHESTKLYTLTCEDGASISVTDFGATLVSVLVPDEDGNMRDVVLGYDDAAGYEKGGVFFGAVVGRNANRIGGATFDLNNVTYTLEKNDNGNNLHSGPDFTNLRLWDVKEQADDHVTFSLFSADGDQGYPGNVELVVTYELTEDHEVRCTYDAVPDEDTILNLTNHSYFNLEGHDSGDILTHTAWIGADYYTKADAESIPTGELGDVFGTPMDFRDGRVIGAQIDADFEAVRLGQGYDHNWVLRNAGKYEKVAELRAPVSGILMEVYTDMPGMQLYSGNFIVREEGKAGAVYARRQGICFETRYFPDAIHHGQFLSPVCKAGEKYHTETAYKFMRRSQINENDNGWH